MFGGRAVSEIVLGTSSDINLVNLCYSLVKERSSPMLKSWKLQPREAKSLTQVTQLAKGQLLGLSLLPGPLPISGGWVGCRRAENTEASLCSIREPLAAWGNHWLCKILRSTFFHLVKAQIAFPPPPSGL